MKKKLKKPKKIKPPKLNRKLFRKTKTVEEKVSDAISVAPQITTDTLADHREDVLSSARKYIYPLQHSKHSIVRISVSLLILAIVAFLLVCGLGLYKFQTTSGFIYDVTKIIPFPVAKVGNKWVSYESYLFELRRNMHYYATQQQTDFSSKDGKTQLVRLKEQAMAEAVESTLVNELAKQNHVSVSDQAVNNQVTILRSENRLGSSDHVFKEVLSQYWGWSEADFKRELKKQLLQQAVVVKLDTPASQRANDALTKLKTGTDFGTLASQVSDDLSTKGNGGQYPNPVVLNDQQVSPELTNILFQLKPGQFSGVIDNGSTLDIVKVLDRSGDSLHAAHIQFNLQDITTYTNPLEANQKLKQYIKV